MLVIFNVIGRVKIEQFVSLMHASLISAKPSLPEYYQERTWEKLKEAVIAIQTSTPIAYCLEELYQAVENMCSHKMDSQLYVNLTGLAENHVKANIKPFLAERIDKLVGIQTNIK
jgi:cullin 4